MSDKALGILKHHFVNTFGSVRLRYLSGKEYTPEELSQVRQKFLDRMNDLEEDIPDGRVSRRDLEQIVAVAEHADWTTMDSVKLLYRTYKEIVGETYDEQELFGRQQD